MSDDGGDTGGGEGDLGGRVTTEPPEVGGAAAPTAALGGIGSLVPRPPKSSNTAYRFKVSDINLFDSALRPHTIARYDKGRFSRHHFPGGRHIFSLSAWPRATVTGERDVARGGLRG